MQPFKYHIFTCDQMKPDGLPCCHARGAGQVVDALRKELGARRLMDRVQLTVCGSIGLCENGPNLVVYPEGTWYSGVRPEDVPELVESHFVNGRRLERLVRKDEAVTRAEIAGNRDRAMAAMKARANFIPDPLAETIRAFQPSRALLTGIELDVFTHLGEGATASEVAEKAGTDPRATEMLLNALVALEALAKREGRFFNTAASRFLAGEQRAGWLHTVNLWDTWSKLTEAVRSGSAPARDEIADRGQAWTEAFIAAMDRGAAERAPVVVQGAGATGVKRMLDLGGGSGAYSIAFARANPELEAVVLDLPGVLPLTERYIEAAGMKDRIGTTPGDLRTDHFGAGFDLVLLSSICHMLDERENADLVRRCREALVPGGRLVIQDFLLEDDKTKPKMAALFSLNMLVGTRGGSSYSVEEYSAWLSDAGFRKVRHVRLPGPSGLIIGTV